MTMLIMRRHSYRQRTGSLMTRSGRRGSSRRGFTIIEVLVAATMAIAFGYIVISSLTSITSMSTDVYKQATTEGNARNVTDLLTRATKNAVPLYECATAETLADCGELKIRKAAFDKTSSTDAWFFAYANRASDGTEMALAEASPNLVHILTRHRGNVAEADDPNADYNWEVCVETYTQPGTAFTVWATTATGTIGTPSTVCAGPIGKPLAGAKTFRFLDSSGNVCEQSSVNGPATDCRADIRNVEMNLALSYRTRSGERYVKPFQSFVAVNAAGLGG